MLGRQVASYVKLRYNCVLHDFGFSVQHSTGQLGNMYLLLSALFESICSGRAVCILEGIWKLR